MKTKGKLKKPKKIIYKSESIHKPGLWLKVDKLPVMKDNLEAIHASHTSNIIANTIACLVTGGLLGYIAGNGVLLNLIPKIWHQ